MFTRHVLLPRWELNLSEEDYLRLQTNPDCYKNQSGLISPDVLR